MPHTPAGKDPFDAAGLENARHAGAVLIREAAFQKIGQRRDAGVRVEADGRQGHPRLVEIVEEDERLEHLPQIAGAEQRDMAPCVRPLVIPAIHVAGTAGDRSGCTDMFNSFNLPVRQVREEI